ncbi:hypothetical protein JZ751_024809 [Albula glossodonta]|uniref:Uncharacterized protein n=1 Tax=Albula glossodonta TaxID=121402 RepID=A0A8T2PFL5_9TELE|nr:hypothetical protein JZ751_024809 [Albula glossodonta]
MQNRICNFRSTEEVILFDSVDKNTAPMQSRPPSPKFTVVRKGGRVTCLVLDVSGSMGKYAGNMWRKGGEETSGGKEEMNRILEQLIRFARHQSIFLIFCFRLECN